MAQTVDTPFPDLNSWIAFFLRAEIPVLRHTMSQLAELRANANKCNARVISTVVLHDPMMTLRVLAYIEAHRNKTRKTDITTIERALMMIGMEPFFNDFEHMPIVENQLGHHPRALLGLLKVLKRSRQATLWARDWALYRHDLDVDEIIVATLLYDFAEILMWCFSPNLALQVVAKQQADRSLRSVNVQIETYNVALYQIKQTLASAWQLPPLLTSLMDPEHAEHPRVRNVKLAVDLARHSANGWQDAAIPDDLKAISELLHINRSTVIQRLGVEEYFPPGEGEENAAQPQ